MTPLAIALQWVAHLARRDAEALLSPPCKSWESPVPPSAEDLVESERLMAVCKAAGERSYVLAQAHGNRERVAVRKAAYAAWCAT